MNVFLGMLIVCMAAASLFESRTIIRLPNTFYMVGATLRNYTTNSNDPPPQPLFLSITTTVDRLPYSLIIFNP